MWSKHFAGAFVCLIIPIVLAAPAENKDGVVESKEHVSSAKETPINQVRPDSDTNNENSVQVDQKATPPLNEDNPPQSPERIDTSPEELGRAMDELTAEDIIRDVLITIRDHPEIMKELIEDKEKELDKQLEESEEADDSVDDEDTTFERPPPQLLQMPKMVEKKSGYDWRKHLLDSSASSASSASDSDSQEDQSRDDSSDESSSNESGSSEQSDSDEKRFAMKKRVPELPEQTIDLTSLPEGGSEKRSKGSENVYKALPEPGKFRNPRHKDQKSQTLENDRFIKPLPIFTADNLKTEDSNQQFDNDMQNVNQKVNINPETKSFIDQNQALPKRPLPWTPRRNHQGKGNRLNQRNHRNHRNHESNDENELKALTDIKEIEA